MPFSGGRIIQLAPHGTSTRKYGTLSHASDKTVVASAIASAEAFGATVAVGPRPALGGITRLSCTGVSIQPYAAFTVRDDEILLAGIASLEAVGSLIVNGGTLQLSLTGIAGAEAFGDITTELAGTISPPSIASEETFGTTGVAPTGTIITTAIGDGQKLVEWDPNSEPDLAGYRVHVGVNSMMYNTTYDVGLTGTPSAPGYVITNLTDGVTYYVAVTAYDTSNNESAFSAEVNFVASAGIRFGDVNVIGNVQLDPTGIASGEAFGTLLMATGPVTVIPASTASAEAFGSHFVLTGDFAIGGIGIPSEEAFGSHTIAFGGVTVDLDTQGIASGEAIGAHSLIESYLIENVGALPSQEALGTPLLNAGEVIVRLIQINSSEAFGTAQLDFDFTLDGIASAEAFGSTALNFDVFPISIDTGEVIGALIVVPEPVDIFPPSIDTVAAFGLMILIPGDLQLPVRVFDARARTFSFPSAR